MWILALVVAPLVVVVISFFALPILEKPRQKFLNAIGIRHKIETQKSEELKPTPLAEAPDVPLVDPIEAVKDVGAQPLLQQADMAKHYVGMRIDCIGRLYGIKEQDNKEVELSVHIRREKPYGLGVGLIFKIDPALYPGLGLLKDDDPVHVSGIIEKLSSRIIHLHEVKLISYGKSLAALIERR
jgi:hypothetical protein